MAYFDTKSGSLEEAIRGAIKEKLVGGQINEKVEYVEYKFKNKNDAMKAKNMLDGIQLMGFDINDDNISNGEISVDAGSKDMTKYHKEVMKKFKPKVMTQEKLDPVNKKALKKDFDDRKDKDIDNDGDVDDSDEYLAKRRKAVSKAINSQKENYELGTPENTKAKLDATPGQSSDDWNKQVETIQKKNMSMREAIAKMWGVEEGHNPFKEGKQSNPDNFEPFKKKGKKEDKTMTGKPMTKVDVDPDMKEVKIGKKTVR